VSASLQRAGDPNGSEKLAAAEKLLEMAAGRTAGKPPVLWNRQAELTATLPIIDYTFAERVTKVRSSPLCFARRRRATVLPSDSQLQLWLPVAMARQCPRLRRA